MIAKRLGAAFLVAFLVSVFSSPWPAHAAQQLKPGGAATKLGRGVVNVVTGWVELPKRMYETSMNQGTAAGLTWGLLRGIGYGFVRTAAGFYEVFTFPVPQPPDYMPVISPEYVFVDDMTMTPATSSSEYKYR